MLCVNKRAAKFSQAGISISRTSPAQTQAQNEARRLTDSPGAQTLMPYLIAKNSGDAIQFCKRAFEAKELVRIEAP